MVKRTVFFFGREIMYYISTIRLRKLFSSIITHAVICKIFDRPVNNLMGMKEGSLGKIESEK